MDTVNLKLLQQDLIRDEGIRLAAYKDSLGLWTQGVGHLLTVPPPYPVWTRERTLEVLDQDTRVALRFCESMSCWASLETEPRRRALVNMRFQLGSRLLTFKNSLRLIESKQWKEAGAELRKSLWYTQTQARAERVIKMIEVG